MRPLVHAVELRPAFGEGISFVFTAGVLNTARLVAVLGSAILATCIACGPTLPPVLAPSPSDPTYAPLHDVLESYIVQTQPYRREAAQAQESTAGKGAPTRSAASAVRTR
jgi:hypothetical protein